MEPDETSARFKIRFHIVSKALETGFQIFCMRDKAKEKVAGPFRKGEIQIVLSVFLQENMFSLGCC